HTGFLYRGRDRIGCAAEPISIVAHRASNVGPRRQPHHSRFIHGSTASRKPSPRKLNASTVSDNIPAGKISMYGCARMFGIASAIISPQLGIGGITPSPKKLIPDSYKI